MLRVIRPQLILTLIGSAVVAALIGMLAYTSGIKTVPEAGGAYVEGLVGQPKLLNPLLVSTTDYPAQSLDALIFSGLVKERPDGQPEPDLASSWKISPDGRTYTFYLRPDVHWQDGQPFNADDVVYTISTIQSSDFPGNADLGAAWRGVQITKLDNLTVSFVLPQPFAPILDYATVGILPAHLLGQTLPADLPASPFNRQPIGTGPYRLRQLDLRSALLETFDSYYGTHPYITRVMLRFYRDDAAVAQAVLKGEVQGDWRVSAADTSTLLKDGHLTFYQAVQPSFSGLCFNLSDPLLAHLEVRQAIAYAVDREALRASLLHGMARTADSPIAPTSWAYDPNVKRYSFDRSQAESVLRSAGWQRNPSGTWAKDGQVLSPAIVTDDAADHVALAHGIAKQLQQAGIAATVETKPFADLVKDVLVPRKFQIALLDWDLPGSDPDPYALWHSSQAGPDGLNFSGWKNRDADQLLEAGRKATDMTVRKAAYVQFQDVFASDLPAFLLFHPVYMYAVDSAVHGVSLPAAAQPWDRFSTISQWYIKTRRVSPIFH